MTKIAMIQKWHIVGLIGVLALGIVYATAIAGPLVSNRASVRGGDVSLIHAYVNQTNAEIRIAHPGPR